jgi:endonuclease-3
MGVEKVMIILEDYYNKIRKPTVRRTSEKSTPFKILISCLLSLRTRDETTEKVTKKLFKKAETPKEILKIPEKELEKLIFSSGYYKNKAKTIKHVSKIIHNKYNGKVPENKEELLKIKGIGPKTANIVLSFAFNKKVIPVDTNVHRISNRLGWVDTGKYKFEKTEKQLEKILPKKWWKEINTLFIQHGRNICTPQSPKCSQCPINKYCKQIGVKRKR